MGKNNNQRYNNKSNDYNYDDYQNQNYNLPESIVNTANINTRKPCHTNS